MKRNSKTNLVFMDESKTKKHYLKKKLNQSKITHQPHS